MGQEINDLKTAKMVALAEGKLMILDFGASWCGPCKKMERELWSKEAFKSFYDRFVLVKIDVDEQRSMAKRFGASALPTVLITTPNEDILYQKVGFEKVNDYLQIFSKFPKDNSKLNQKLLRVISKESAPGFLSIGKELGALAMQISDPNIRNGYIQQSDEYLDKSEKLDDAGNLSDMILFFKSKNKILKSSRKKSIKMLKRLKKNGAFEGKPDYYNFLYALLYKRNDQQTVFQEYYASIESDNFKKELDSFVLKR